MNKLIGVAVLLTASHAAAQAQADQAATTVGGYVGQVSSLVFETRTELAPAVTGARRAEVCQFAPKKVQALLDRGTEVVNQRRSAYAASSTPQNASLYLAATQARGALQSIQEGVNAACLYAREPRAADALGSR